LLVPRLAYLSTFRQVKSRNIEITTIGSNYHIEMNPSDVGLSDRLVIQEVIKEIAQTHTLDPSTQKNFKGAGGLEFRANAASLSTFVQWLFLMKWIVLVEKLNKHFAGRWKNMLPRRIHHLSATSGFLLMSTFCLVAASS